MHALDRSGPQSVFLDSQALAAFCAARIDHCATPACLHANQEAVGTGTTDFRWLISAFHLEFLTGSFLIQPLLIGVDLGLIALNTIRGAIDYRKFSEPGQHLASGTRRNAVSSGWP